jgi:hypothetical protein
MAAPPKHALDTWAGQALLFLLGAAVFVAAIEIRDCLVIDKCLDHGGRWDDDPDECER